MKLSARNALRGTVVSVEHGAVNSEVVLELGDGQQVVAVVTRKSAEGLDLEAGATAYAVIKASSVVIGTD